MTGKNRNTMYPGEKKNRASKTALLNLSFSRAVRLPFAIILLCDRVETNSINPVSQGKVTGQKPCIHAGLRRFNGHYHTVEDIGICLGDAFSEALGDKRGTVRYGSVLLPMDEALILTAVDLSGRGMLYWDMHIPTPKVGSFDTELAEEFFIALARRGDMTIHVRQLAGSNSHHIIEGAFKGLARSLSAAAAIDSRFPLEIPSTKGVL